MTGEQYNEAVRDMNDPRKMSQFLVDQYGPDGQLKNPDMTSGFLTKAMDTLNFETAWKPSKFVNNPIFRYMNEKFHAQVIQDNINYTLDTDRREWMILGQDVDNEG